MFKETLEMLEAVTAKIDEMQKNYSSGKPWSVPEEEFVAMCAKYASLSAIGATQFYTVVRSRCPETFAKNMLAQFFATVQERVIQVIDEGEAKRKKREGLN